MSVKSILRCTWCMSKTFRRLSSTADSSLPCYNYDLPGRGKSKKSQLSNTIIPAVHGEFLYGVHPVVLALKAQRRTPFYCLYTTDQFERKSQGDTPIKEILELALGLGVPIQYVSKQVLDNLSGNRPHQGVCLDAEKFIIPRWDEKAFIESVPDMQLWLLLHNIQDPMNFGAVLRTAHYFAVDRVVVPSSNSCKLSAVVSKASAGAMEVANLVSLPPSTSEAAFCQWWKSNGGEVIGTDAGFDGSPKSVRLDKFAVKKPTVLILGNEGSGLSKDLEDCCDRMLTIPGNEPSHLEGKIGSLNVSVAAGIMIHWIGSSKLDGR